MNECYYVTAALWLLRLLLLLLPGKIYIMSVSTLTFGAFSIGAKMAIAAASLHCLSYRFF